MSTGVWSSIRSRWRAATWRLPIRMRWLAATWVIGVGMGAIGGFVAGAWLVIAIWMATGR